MNYELIALDVDGTLLDADGCIPPAVALALKKLERAGVRICLATGRSYIETQPVWKQLSLAGPYQPMVLVGGALVSEPDTGRTLWQKTVAPEVLREYAADLQGRGFSVLASVDPWRYGYDYHTAVGADYEDVQTRWFGQMDVKIRTCQSFQSLTELPAAIRLNSLVSDRQGRQLLEELQDHFGDRLNLHVIHAPNYGVTVLEAFSPGADKAAGLRYIAQGLSIPMGRIVAIGDDVNDLAMIRAAGLGVAMPNAKDFVKQAAGVVAEDGLAAFLEDLAASD
ncbi:MAG: HAD-IIB family hydrolase [Planctomycetota bacterium]